MKKKILALVLMLMLVTSVSVFALAAAETAVDWNAIVESGNAASALPEAEPGAAVSIDWSGIITNLIYGVLGAVVLFIGSVIVYVIMKFLIPLLPALVQWLNDKRMLWLAKILVNAAEVMYGRFSGDQKLDKVYEWLRERGILVTDKVQQMIDNAWQELNNKMIELGLKEASSTSGTTADGGTGDPFTGTDTPVHVE